MLNSKIKKLEKLVQKQEMNSVSDNIYNKDVVIIRSLKDFMEVYSDEPPHIKPTAKVLMTKEMRHFIDHYYDDDEKKNDE